MTNRLIVSGMTFVAVANVSMSPAKADVIDAIVDARSMPWSLAANPTLRIGMRGYAGRPPKVIWNRNLIAGAKVTFVARGSASFWPGYSTGPEGYEASAMVHDYNAAMAGVLTRGIQASFPSAYASNARDIRVLSLVGAFVNADGEVIGKPFIIGNSYTTVVPDGASAISLGVNDAAFPDNTGQYTVSIDIRGGTAIVEPQ